MRTNKSVRIYSLICVAYHDTTLAKKNNYASHYVCCVYRVAIDGSSVS